MIGKVNATNAQYNENISSLVMINDLYEGTKKIKQNGRKYLNQFKLEEDDNYTERLTNSVFYNFLAKTITNLSGLISRKKYVLKHSNSKVENIVKNIDSQGSTLEQFIKQISIETLKDGMSFLWIDYNRITTNLSKIQLKDTLPFLKLIKRQNVLNYKTETINGNTQFKQITISQSIEVDINDFETETKDCYIVLTKNECYVYTKNEKGGFDIIDQWTNNLGIIPIIPVYAEKKGFADANIPLLDLAYLNLSHYNASGDYSHILRLAAVPVPVIYTNNEYDKKVLAKEGISIGVTKAISFSDRQSEGFEFVEISGSSITQLKQNITDIEERMEKTALSVLANKSFNTATEAKIADNNNALILVELAFSIESALNQAFVIMELYLAEKLDCTITLNKDFNAYKIDANIIDKYIIMKREGLISIDTFWDMLTKGEVLEIADYDLEKQKIEDDQSKINVLE